MFRNISLLVREVFLIGRRVVSQPCSKAILKNFVFLVIEDSMLVSVVLHNLNVFLSPTFGVEYDDR